jgi:hypothetical protein
LSRLPACWQPRQIACFRNEAASKAPSPGQAEALTRRRPLPAVAVRIGDRQGKQEPGRHFASATRSPPVGDWIPARHKLQPWLGDRKFYYVFTDCDA